MLKSIYASKIYKCSKYKDRIHAAIQNPINYELVQQLKSYVIVPESDNDNDVNLTELDTVIDTANNAVQEAASSKTSDKEYSSSNHGLPEDLNDEKDLNSCSANLADTSTADTLNTVESIKCQPNSIITSQTALYSGECKCCDAVSLPSIVEQIKGMLNLHEGTKGVLRAIVKDSELWIYYKDSINLNNIMAAVIDLIDASGYSYLEFNRLARSDNAIVFEINSAISSDQVQSITDTN